MNRVAGGIGVALTLLVGLLIAGNFTDLNLQELKHLSQEPRFIKALRFSLLTSGGATLGAFVFGIPAALWLSRRRTRGARLCAIVLELPLVIPPLIIGVLLLQLANQALVQNVFNLVFTFQGALLAQFFVALPLLIKAAEGAFRLIPSEYEHIAMSMGASPLRAFVDTTWRLAWPGILPGIVMAWMRALGEFGATLMVGGGITGKTENIPIFIYLSISEGDFSAGMGACALLILTVIVILLLLRWRSGGKVSLADHIDS
ncbi:MAG: molybdate ABC transporter permease subunit [Thermodesulfobacteriota bacterium]